MYIIEVITVADEASSSSDIKVMQFVLKFHAARASDFMANMRIQGYFSTSPDIDADKSSAERTEINRRIAGIKTKLVAQGVPDSLIAVIGLAHSAQLGGQIVLSSGSILDQVMPRYVPPVPILPGLPGSTAQGSRPIWIDAEGSVTADPKGKEINTEVKVTYMAGGLLSGKSIAVNFVIGPDGQLKEAGAELKLKSFKAKIVDEWSRGIITDVKFSIKLASSYDMQRDTEEKERLKTKLKGVLEADIGIPNTQFRIGAEAGAYVDTAGKPGVQLNFTLFKF